MKKNGQTLDETDLVVVTTAGEALLIRDAVYISSADGKAYKCDNTDPLKSDFFGFAQAAASALAAINVVADGHLGGFSGLTIGATYYLSTAGAITATAPTISHREVVGFAVSATTIKLEKRRNTQYYTVAGTYTIPPWATLLYVEGWSAGASGSAVRGNGTSAEAGGGASGGHRSALIPISALGGVATVAVAVGVGGAAINIASGTSTVATVGNAGGNTTFGSFLTVNGGGAPGASSVNETAVLGGVAGAVSGGNLVVITEAGVNGGGASSVGVGSASAGGNGTEAGGSGAGAASDGSSGLAYSAAGGTSTRAGAGGASAAAYQTGSGVLQATNGGFKGGGGGAVAHMSDGVTNRQLISGKGGDGFFAVTAM